MDKKHEPEQVAGQEMYVPLQAPTDINAEKLLGSFSKSGTRTSRAVASALCNDAADQCVTELNDHHTTDQLIPAKRQVQCLSFVPKQAIAPVEVFLCHAHRR